MLAQEIKDGDLQPERIDESLISAKTYTAGVPDPDLIIRTSGELRLSNFLIWQAAYAEYFFTGVLWPDFKKENLHEALFEYQQRKRRMGGSTVSIADSKSHEGVELPVSNAKKSTISETSA
jgi:undecaprenyl diphosphate synthase